jgi:hypothetical protein
MNNPALLRSLIIYAICIPLAITVGYQLTGPFGGSLFTFLGALGFLLMLPILLKWHHMLLVVTWNVTAVIFFLPGNPHLWLFIACMSLGISVLHRASSKEKKFINIPPITLSLIALGAITIITAQLTGGIGVRALGSDVYGGRRYIYLLGAIIGYFALTAHRIPMERSSLWVGLFFLGAITSAIGELIPYVSGPFQFIFWIFPPNFNLMRAGEVELGTTRLGGTWVAAIGIVYFLVMKFGVSGLLDFRKPWRLLLLLAVLWMGMLSGFRSVIITAFLVFAVQFLLEGLHKTKLMPITIAFGIITLIAIVPLASKLPFTVQRALAIFPLKLDPIAVLDAQGSTAWRVQMWKAVLPEIPEYIWLGKGYAVSTQDVSMMRVWRESADFAANWDSAIVGDYHNGPLSVILPFGIWGSIAFLWFIIAAWRLMHFNFMYGDPQLKRINTVLYSIFIMRVIFFFGVFGSLHSDLWAFTGLLGLSVSLNGGKASKPEQVQSPQATQELAVPFRRTRSAFS